MRTFLKRITLTALITLALSPPSSASGPWNPAGPLRSAKTRPVGEVWIGPSVRQASFSQANFGATYRQLGGGVFGGATFQPRFLGPFSLRMRAEAILGRTAPRFSPAQDLDEAVQLLDATGDVRLEIALHPAVSLIPSIGGTVLGTAVRTKKFGIEQALSPMLGLDLAIHASRSFHFGPTFRLVQLQTDRPFSYDSRRSMLDGGVNATFGAPGRVRGLLQLSTQLLRYTPPPTGLSAFEMRSWGALFGLVFPILSK